MAQDILFDSELVLLSSKFFQDYPAEEYNEIASKNERPYMCLLIDTHEDYFICIPFRSFVRHKNAFLFSKSVRTEKAKLNTARSGLDYSKIVLIRDCEYLDSTQNPTIDQDEYNETRTNIRLIAQEAKSYVDNYINHVKGIRILHEREFARKYRYSTLKYFHDIMGLC